MTMLAPEAWLGCLVPSLPDMCGESCEWLAAQQQGESHKLDIYDMAGQHLVLYIFLANSGDAIGCAGLTCTCWSG